MVALADSNPSRMPPELRRHEQEPQPRRCQRRVLERLDPWRHGFLYGPNPARPIPSPKARVAMGATGNPYTVAPSSLETIQVMPKLRTLAGQDPETLRKQVATDFQPEQFH